LLTQLSVFWFKHLADVLPNHFVTADLDEMPESVREYRDQLEGRSMLVKKLKILPVEAIVRGYLSGSGWAEYKKKGTVCDIHLPSGLRESDKLSEPLFTPSTKAEIGDHGMLRWKKANTIKTRIFTQAKVCFVGFD
jgi:phosphoribosylaminoimidazole-succinocarboxamide synthase